MSRPIALSKSASRQSAAVDGQQQIVRPHGRRLCAEPPDCSSATKRPPPSGFLEDDSERLRQREVEARQFLAARNSSAPAMQRERAARWREEQGRHHRRCSTAQCVNTALLESCEERGVHAASVLRRKLRPSSWPASLLKLRRRLFDDYHALDGELRRVPPGEMLSERSRARATTRAASPPGGFFVFLLAVDSRSWLRPEDEMKLATMVVADALGVRRTARRSRSSSTRPKAPSSPPSPPPPTSCTRGSRRCRSPRRTARLPEPLSLSGCHRLVLHMHARHSHLTHSHLLSTCSRRGVPDFRRARSRPNQIQ